MARIAVAVSGGADSLYALISLQEQGHEVFALHGLFLPSASAEESLAVTGLRTLCQERNIPLHIVDFRADFRQHVVMPFVQAYAQGHTPNPCALCNKGIKFGLLMDKALALGAELFATGHYARLQEHTSEAQSPLGKGQDIRKDQSYFLALVPRERFSQVLFPLACTQKTANIQYLQERGINIPVAQESQEICFIPNDAYREFIPQACKEFRIKLGKCGPIYIREDGQDILLPKKYGGQHQGLWQYTEGQRRGLGVAWKEPLYVCAKDSARNALILGSKEEAKLQGCEVHFINYLVPHHLWTERILVRVRYRQQEMPARIEHNQDMMRIVFDEPQAPTAPGQIAAVYDEQGHILAGGLIKNVF